MRYLLLSVLLLGCRAERPAAPRAVVPVATPREAAADDTVTPRALDRVISAYAHDGDASFVYGCEAPDSGPPEHAVGDAVDLYAPTKRLGRFRVARIEHDYCCDHWSCEVHVTIPRDAATGNVLAVWPCRASSECDLGTCVAGQCTHAAAGASASRPYPTQAEVRREGLEPHDRLHAFDLDGDGATDAVSYVEDLAEEDGGTRRDYPTALFLYDPGQRAWVMQHISEP